MLSVMLALLICRIYFQKTPPLRVAGLALVMLGLAYLFQYTKKRDKGGGNGK